MISARHGRSAIRASAATSTSWPLRGTSDPTLTMTGGTLPPAARTARSVPGGATVMRGAATPRPAVSRRKVAGLVTITDRTTASEAASAASSRALSSGDSPASSPSG